MCCWYRIHWSLEAYIEVEFLVGNNDELYFLEKEFRDSKWSYASTVVGMNLPILFTLDTLKHNGFRL